MDLSALTKPEVDYFRDNGNFTDDETKVFEMLTKGRAITEIALQMCVSESTIDRKIRKIKHKILKIGGLHG